MYLSTPDRPNLPSLDTFTRSALFSLPPLSLLLNNDTSRPRLPSIDTFTTPSTPRYMLPPSVVPTSAVPRLERATPKMQHTPAETPNEAKRSYNISMDSEADCSMNDSMVRPASKRKPASTSPTRDFAFISHSPATYPSQEPSIDNASLARRKRRRTSPNELAILNLEFEGGSTPNKLRRVEIANKVNMTEKAVQIWFQNKRQLLRRLKTADREITVLPPTPDSSAMASAIPTDSAPTPLLESTPIKPTLKKSQSQEAVSPAMAQLSPIRSFSTSNLTQKPKESMKVSLLSKMLASRDERPKEGLVLNLTTKKQPDFVRTSPAASTQVMTFKLGPSKPVRKPLGELNTNRLSAPVAKPASESQCVQNLLSLRTANY